MKNFVKLEDKNIKFGDCNNCFAHCCSGIFGSIFSQILKEEFEDVYKNFPIYALISIVVGYLLSIVLIPKVISQRTAGIINLILAIALVTIALIFPGLVSVIAIILLSFTNAILWPVIWPLSIQGLGRHTKLGSAFLIMAIAGGAVLPIFYSRLAELFNSQTAYSVLYIAYGFMLFFVTIGCKIKKWS